MCMMVCDGSCATRISVSTQDGTSLPVRLGFLLADLAVLTFRIIVKPLVRYVVVPVAVAMFVLTVRAVIALLAAARQAWARHRSAPRQRPAVRVSTRPAQRTAITAEPCVTEVTLADLVGKTPARHAVSSGTAR
jgi:hypothetical protein